MTSSNVVVHSTDEEDELNKKIINFHKNEENKENEIKNAEKKNRKTHSIHITSEHSLSPKNDRTNCRFFSPSVKNDKMQEALKNQKKNGKKEKSEKKPKEILQKDIFALKSEISRLIWEEERRVKFFFNKFLYFFKFNYFKNNIFLINLDKNPKRKRRKNRLCETKGS